MYNAMRERHAPPNLLRHTFSLLMVVLTMPMWGQSNLYKQYADSANHTAVYKEAALLFMGHPVNVTIVTNRDPRNDSLGVEQLAQAYKAMGYDEYLCFLMGNGGHLMYFREGEALIEQIGLEPQLRLRVMLQGAFSKEEMRQMLNELNRSRLGKLPIRETLKQVIDNDWNVVLDEDGLPVYRDRQVSERLHILAWNVMRNPQDPFTIYYYADSTALFFTYQADSVIVDCGPDNRGRCHILRQGHVLPTEEVEAMVDRDFYYHNTHKREEPRIIIYYPHVQIHVRFDPEKGTVCGRGLLEQPRYQPEEESSE